MGNDRLSSAAWAILEHLAHPVGAVGPDGRVARQNAAHRQIFGEVRGLACHAALRGRSEPCSDCPRQAGRPTIDPGSSGAGPAGRCSCAEAGTVVHEVLARVPEGAAMPLAVGRAVEAAGAAVFLESLDGTVLAMNRAAEGLYGLDRVSWVGRSLAELLPEEARELLPLVVREMEERGAFRVEAWQRRVDGSRFLGLIEGVRLDGPDAPFALVTVRDVTGERQSLRELEDRSRELEDFLHTVAHDLRAPLVGIKGYATLLQRGLPEESTGLRGHAQRVLWQAERLESFLEDLLEFAEIGHDAELALVLDPEATARAAWTDLGPWAEEAGPALEVEGPLPRVRLVPVRLGQVFCNLFSNALKYRRAGTPLAVRVSAVRPEPEWQVPGDHVVLVVEDNGLGVPLEDHGRIFELFRQGSGGREGNGLGLAIVRRIVETAGGRIWVESSVGEGSRFYLTLPRAEAEEGHG